MTAQRPKPRLLYTIVEGILRPLFTLIWRIEIIGAERVPQAGPCILAANHDSVLDGFFLAIATRRQLRFMGRAEVFRWPVLGWIMHGVGAFPVERGADEGRAVAKGVELLERGEAIGMFPEGTSLPHRKRGWKRGTARLALATGAPIVPVALVNTERTLEPVTHRIGFPRVRIVIGEPIAVERAEPTEETAAALTERLEEAVEALRRSGR